MFFVIGVIIVFGSVISGYVLHHGDLAVLNQPTEFLIIGGSGIGSFIISNPSPLIKKILASFKLFFKPGAPYKKDQYIELLSFMYNIFKFMKTKGMLEVESHIEDPHGSDLFSPYPTFAHNHHATDFFCDYIRLMTMGIDNHYQLEDLMDAELDAHHHDNHEVAHAVSNLGDSFPALGIVAAVLGVIVTMGSISEPPEILGGLVGAALVGTFLGILLAYGLVSPMGSFLGKWMDVESKYYEVIKVGILTHAQGNAPAISIEFARKSIPEYVRPSFSEVEEAMESA